ncbi:MAG: DUF302 domain-containing protein [Gammaproteobacteria bacterium]|nr:DUF302 domain-containing protein [Gammaproteobacteria bacterium]
MYHFFVDLKGTLSEFEPRLVAALKAEGFGVITEIDIQATLKKKLDIEKRPYKILGACNPGLANQALDFEPEIGLLLPCNVVIRECDNETVRISFMDPEAVLTLVDREEVAVLAKEVKERLLRVMESLKG